MANKEEKDTIYTEDLRVKTNKKAAIKKTIIGVIVILIVCAIAITVTFVILYVKNQ